MKLIHLSDLHLGKRVNEYSMLDDQQYILGDIIRVIAEEAPDAVLIAGDIYDRSVPPTEAVTMLDDFLSELTRLDTRVFMIGGNHDSAERLAYLSRFMTSHGVHISPAYSGAVEPITLADGYGEVHFYLLPFVKPAHVRAAFPERETESFTDAVRTAVEAMDIDPESRNVLVAHQLVTGAERCASEELSVGGADDVDRFVFEGFDYVALGHLHGPQRAGSGNIRYCGSPLKYSFSEVGHKKGVLVVELAEKGSLTVRQIPLVPKRDMREVKGTLAEIIAGAEKSEDYIRVILTDEQEQPAALSDLRKLYPNLMKLSYDNARTRSASVFGETADSARSPRELFGGLFERQNGRELSGVQTAFLDRIISEVWEDEE